MFCTSCGQKLHREASFCSRCGRPQIEAAEGATPANSGIDEANLRWESAQVSWQRVDVISHRFAAEVRSPSGTSFILDPYRLLFNTDKRAGPRRRDRNVSRSHATLVARLVQDGWEPVGVGEPWWSERFRRPFVPRAHCEICFIEHRFVADVLSTDGNYIALKTDRLAGWRERTAIEAGRQAHADLKAQIEAAGWEQIEPWGDEWWQLRFGPSSA